MSFGRESRFQEIHVVPFRTLLDERGILKEATFPPRNPDPSKQREMLHRVLFWFWHELSHFTAALGRDQLWWAYGQLEAMRAMCVNLARIEQGRSAEDEAYEKLDEAISTTQLSALRATHCPMERRAMARAGRDILHFYRERAPLVARANGLHYPADSIN